MCAAVQLAARGELFCTLVKVQQTLKVVFTASYLVNLRFRDKPVAFKGSACNPAARIVQAVELLASAGRACGQLDQVIMSHSYVRPTPSTAQEEQ